jgi:hypothetical protein
MASVLKECKHWPLLSLNPFSRFDWKKTASALKEQKPWLS